MSIPGNQLHWYWQP